MAKSSSISFKTPAASPGPRDQARAAVRPLLFGFEDWPAAAEAKCLSCDPMALANQFIFAIVPRGDGHGHCSAIIAPLDGQGADEAFGDRAWPIGHLLPKGSEDMGDDGWTIGGRPLPFEAAQLRASKGFQWTRNFQTSVDKRMADDGMARLRASFEAAELAKHAPAPKAVAPSRNLRV